MKYEYFASSITMIQTILVITCMVIIVGCNKGDSLTVQSPTDSPPAASADVSIPQPIADPVNTPAPPPDLEHSMPAATPPALNFTLKSIDGRDVALSDYRDKVVLIVNVASRCGYTKQYADLQALHDIYASKGLAILGFPCNQFGKQEPGTDEQIKTFCSTKFNVKFDMFSKIDVKGDAASPLYRYLTGDLPGVTDTGRVKWNFEKFLIDRSGTVVGRYRSKVLPTGREITSAIETALAQ